MCWVVGGLRWMKVNTGSMDCFDKNQEIFWSLMQCTIWTDKQDLKYLLG
jgi:hypothetical protein